MNKKHFERELKDIRKALKNLAYFTIVWRYLGNGEYDKEIYYDIESFKKAVFDFEASGEKALYYIVSNPRLSSININGFIDHI